VAALDDPDLCLRYEPGVFVSGLERHEGVFPAMQDERGRVDS
jgi:hypothetical protein